MSLLRTPRLPIQLHHFLYVDLALAPVTVLFVELTSRKWYTMIRSMAAEPRKMASVYRSLSEIILASFVRHLAGGLTGKIEEGSASLAAVSRQETELYSFWLSD